MHVEKYQLTLQNSCRKILEITFRFFYQGVRILKFCFELSLTLYQLCQFDLRGMHVVVLMIINALFFNVRHVLFASSGNRNTVAVEWEDCKHLM